MAHSGEQIDSNQLFGTYRDAEAGRNWRSQDLILR
jgi:hypothetical protein